MTQKTPDERLDGLAEAFKSLLLAIDEMKAEAIADRCFMFRMASFLTKEQQSKCHEIRASSLADAVNRPSYGAALAEIESLRSPVDLG